MRILKMRPRRNPAKARDGYVEVLVDGRWWGNRETHVKRCSKWTEGEGYACPARGIDDFEFVQLEDAADCDLVEAAGERPWRIAYGNVFRRCKICGHYYHTGYGYRPRRTRGSLPLAVGSPYCSFA